MPRRSPSSPSTWPNSAVASGRPGCGCLTEEWRWLLMASVMASFLSAHLLPHSHIPILGPVCWTDLVREKHWRLDSVSTKLYSFQKGGRSLKSTQVGRGRGRERRVCGRGKWDESQSWEMLQMTISCVALAITVWPNVFTPLPVWILPSSKLIPSTLDSLPL